MKSLKLLPLISPSRRRLLQTFVAALALAVTGLATHPAAFGAARDRDQDWVGTWTSSQRIPTGAAANVAFDNQILRQIVYTSLGGDEVRVRNTFVTVEIPV